MLSGDMVIARGCHGDSLVPFRIIRHRDCVGEEVF